MQQCLLLAPNSKSILLPFVVTLLIKPIHFYLSWPSEVVIFFFIGTPTREIMLTSKIKKRYSYIYIYIYRHFHNHSTTVKTLRFQHPLVPFFRRCHLATIPYNNLLRDRWQVSRCWGHLILRHLLICIIFLSRGNLSAAMLLRFHGETAPHAEEARRTSSYVVFINLMP